MLYKCLECGRVMAIPTFVMMDERNEKGEVLVRSGCIDCCGHIRPLGETTNVGM